MNWYKQVLSIRDMTREQIFKEIKKFGPSGKEYPGEIDEEIEKNKDDGLIRNLNLPYLRRNKFVPEYSWAVPNQRLIENIVKFIGSDKVLEIGAGNGLWSKLLNDYGINIFPTDPNASGNFIDVEKLNHMEALEKYYDSNVLIFIWPSYGCTFAEEALESFNGSKIIYIGEGHGGCTASDRFHYILKENWRLVYSDNTDVKEEYEPSDWIDNWEGIHDRVFFYIRKKGTK